MSETMSENQTPAATATKDTQNGVTRPKADTKTGRIWEIADSLSAQEGAPVARYKVLNAAMAEGLNAATASTQYGRWRKYHGLGAEPKEAAEGGEGSDVSIEADSE
jgi:hypothetical protein